MPFPTLRARDPKETHRAATPLELLFDLVSVVAIASVTAELHHAISSAHGIDILPIFMFLFVAIWWTWLNFTWFASAFDNDRPLYRVLVMIIMGGQLLFASGVSHIIETSDFSWGLVGWIVMRIGMIGLWLQASRNAEYRRTSLRYAYGLTFAQLCWIVLYFSVSENQTVFLLCGGLIFAIELAVPAYAEKAKMTPFHRHHVIERYGLLAIISLGEIILSITLAFAAMFGDGSDLMPAITAVSALVIVFAAFWVYFTDEDHLPSVNFDIVFAWGYGHVLVFGALAVAGAGIAAEVDLATHNAHGATQESVARWLGVALAVYWLTLSIIRDRHHRLGARQFALPFMAVAAILGALIGAPSIYFAGISVIAAVWRVPVRSS